MEYIDTILNDIEKLEVERFANNKTMINAVRKILLAGIYYNGTLKAGEDPNPLVNFALTLVSDVRGHVPNEQIGAELRAKSEGLIAVETGFKFIEGTKSVVEKPKVKGLPSR